MKTIKETKLAEYEKLIIDFTTEEEHSNKDLSAENSCKVSIRKLILAKNFAQIDNDILELSLEAANNSSTFFSNLLYLEAKRLRFKEEAFKCAEKTKNRTKIKI